MPIYLLEQPDDNCIWGIWANQNEEGLDNSAMPPAGAMPGAAVTHAGKLQQKISSRMLVKALLEKCALPYYGIIRNDHSKPYLLGHPFYISLSHTASYSAAIFHKSTDVGIDIELVRPKLYSVAEKYLCDDELDRAGDDLKKLCVYWGVKEVVYKIYGLRNISLRQHIFISPFDFNEAGGMCEATLSLRHEKWCYQVKYLKVGDHYLTVSIV